MTQTKIEGDKKPTMDEADIYRAAVDLWGQRAQLDMVIEECSELTKAITKYRRNRDLWFNIFDEAADVQVMIEQLKYMFLFDKTDWDELMIVKLEQLKEQIEESKKKRAKINK